MVRTLSVAMTVLCCSVWLLAQAPAGQAPAGQGRGAAQGGPGRGAAAPAGAPGGQQSAPPVPADPNAVSGQGRGGALFGHAHANIAGANGLKGTADFYEIANGNNGHMVEVILSVQNAPPGMHGVHIHAVGKCEGTDYTTAGGHFDPGPSGNPDPDANHPFHMGDLPNVTVAANGSGGYNVYTTRVTMGGPTGLFDADGSAIVIHANLDPGIGGATGSGTSGGPRIACGVIER